MMTLVDEIKHVIYATRVVDTLDNGVRVLAVSDITAPGYVFDVKPLAEVVDDLYYLAKEKDFFNRNTFSLNDEQRVGKTEREQWALRLERTRLRRRPGKEDELLGPETVAVWEEWKDGVKVVSQVVFRDPEQPSVLWLRIALGSNLMENFVLRRRVFWDIGIREYITSLPKDHYMIPQHLERGFVIKGTFPDGAVLLSQTVETRP